LEERSLIHLPAVAQIPFSIVSRPSRLTSIRIEAITQNRRINDMLEAFNFRVILEYMPLYLQCFLATLWLSALSLLGAIVVGTIACAMRLSQSRTASRLAGIYIESIRSTPLLAQLYFFYFGLPSIGIMLPEWITGIIALTLNSGAYYAEIIRDCVRTDRGRHRLRLELFSAHALYHFTSGARYDHPAHAGTGYRSRQGFLAPFIDFDRRVDTGRSVADIRSIYACRRVPDHSRFLSDYLLHAQRLLELVRKTTDIPGSALRHEG
jgi:His/Glu/Gln/Arg/opine family amino acid ABC transporter permease subunit